MRGVCMFQTLKSVWPLGLLGLVAAVCAPVRGDEDSAPRLITQPVDERVLVELTGNTRPEATLWNDRGRVDDTMPLEHMQLLLMRPADTEADLVSRIEQ